ncbi:hypothetical protein PP304_gp032 [Gordonia phage Phendrix]|uniref:Uncharacterized protein n=2 Tax=Godonkavirus TaxID=2733178 RepID=A0A4D6E2B0_9CAUD|nr:hypothetical protein HOV33_gp032 [Gordonia phage GodonK]YP_010649076.1 hypothetical protein PP304_gp032 [Gordonia phage Phendrix]QBZ72651.1 hypothetical protein SEA_GODONK_32 [Gordonia phage GodonK]QDK02580.1 hypothetical protein SEA_PHENDRIX_32 [Gordonia phage Phendrix]
MFIELPVCILDMHRTNFVFDHPYYRVQCSCEFMYVSTSHREVIREESRHMHWAKTGEMQW